MAFLFQGSRHSNQEIFRAKDMTYAFLKDKYELGRIYFPKYSPSHMFFYKVKGHCPIKRGHLITLLWNLGWTWWFVWPWDQVKVKSLNFQGWFIKNIRASAWTSWNAHSWDTSLLNPSHHKDRSPRYTEMLCVATLVHSDHLSSQWTTSHRVLNHVMESSDNCSPQLTSGCNWIKDPK